ncbi:serine/threonine-protein kinase [Streptomyces sanglieri]|uniref:non-specific serine/threonine protein kinase n=1 Tax=Streptomyces sanglieri TaxID=193460 RepID=A0ABW2WRA9_9ACTN
MPPSSQLAPAGTPQYGAPEQFLSERGDARSDLYALGSVLFALLTGRPPFTGHTSFAIMQRKLTEDAPHLDTLRPDLPPALTRLVAELLEREPDRRPQTAEEVHEYLGRLRTALAAPGASAATTVTATPPRRVVPPPTEREPARDGAFEISWTGQEPITEYAPAARWRNSQLVLFLVVHLAATAAGLYVTVLSIQGHFDNDSWLAILAPLSVLSLILAILGLFKLAENTHQCSRHRSALRNRSPWSLHVGPGGITTTDNFRRTIPWEQVKTVTTEIIDAPEWYAYPGLHVRFFKRANVTPYAPRAGSTPATLLPARKTASPCASSAH